MSVKAYSVGGRRMVSLDLDARTMLDVWFALEASLSAEETTISVRATVAGLTQPLKRALVAIGAINQETANALELQLQRKPAAPPLDARAPFWTKES